MMSKEKLKWLIISKFTEQELREKLTNSHTFNINDEYVFTWWSAMDNLMCYTAKKGEEAKGSNGFYACCKTEKGCIDSIINDIYKDNMERCGCCGDWHEKGDTEKEGRCKRCVDAKVYYSDSFPCEGCGVWFGQGDKVETAYIYGKENNNE